MINECFTVLCCTKKKKNLKIYLERVSKCPVVNVHCKVKAHKWDRIR